MPRRIDDGAVDDPYLSGTCRWWHLTEPSPELLAIKPEAAVGTGGTSGPPLVAVDLGCGLGTEIGYLTGRGWHGLGVDLSAAALFQAHKRHRTASFARADVTRLPLRAGSADLLLDRGCFHYLGPAGRARYAAEARRVLRAGGRLLLRMCLNSAGRPNGLTEDTIRTTFSGWKLLAINRTELISDTRLMPAVTASLIRP
jgi:SAM-dependent methyltransferase